MQVIRESLHAAAHCLHSLTRGLTKLEEIRIPETQHEVTRVSLSYTCMLIIAAHSAELAHSNHAIAIDY